MINRFRVLAVGLDGSRKSFSLMLFLSHCLSLLLHHYHYISKN
ncbi:hypothetical protein C5167_005592, partial [Papaver somniferum]